MNNEEVKIIIKTDEDKYEYNVGIYINRERGEISYVEDDKYKTFVSFNYKSNILKRDNNKMYMELDFYKEKGYFLEKELNKSFDLLIRVKNINFTNNSIVIEYYNNGKFYEYKILSLKK